MDLQYHQLSDDAFTALASGGGGSDAVCELASAEYSKHVVLLAGVLEVTTDKDQYRLARMGFDVLAEAWRADPAAVRKVITYPSVGAWALRAVRACRGGTAASEAKPSGMLRVAAAAAIRSGLPVELEVPVIDGRVTCPSLGAATVPGHTARLHIRGKRAELGPVEVPVDPHQNAPGWQGLSRVRAGAFDILIDDLDPFRLPGLADLAPRSGFRCWDTSLREAWNLLESQHPDVAAEVAAGVSVIVPRMTPPKGLVSTTSPRAFGAVGMSLPPDPVIGAETLAHEIQHIKLGAIQDILALTLPDDGSRYYAPWRDDPRPLNGLLQGTYAYLGVTGFWRRQRRFPCVSRHADAEYALWREATARSIETIRSSGRLTSAGMDFISEMANTIASWKDERIPAHAQVEAREAADAHLTRWLSHNAR